MHVSDWQLLNDWCRLVRYMFGDEESYGVFLVGSSLKRSDYRDVDIRIMLKDDVFHAQYPLHKQRYLNLAISLWGQKVTGLPIDFQIQGVTEADKEFSGQRRDAIGMKL